MNSEEQQEQHNKPKQKNRSRRIDWTRRTQRSLHSQRDKPTTTKGTSLMQAAGFCQHVSTPPILRVNANFRGPGAYSHQPRPTAPFRGVMRIVMHRVSHCWIDRFTRKSIDNMYVTDAEPEWRIGFAGALVPVGFVGFHRDVWLPPDTDSVWAN